MNPFILIIDDDLPTLELYRRELSRDYQVLACKDEGEAMKHVSGNQLLAVVLEPAISGGHGWCLLDKILQASAPHPVPVVLVSTQDERRRGLEAGASAFLVKPVLPTDLRETLRRIIQGQSLSSAT